MAATAVKSAPTFDKVMREVARKIKKEMNDIATSKHDSILRDTVEAVKHFSWDTVTIELQMKTPILMQLLRSLVRNPAKSKPFIASIACQLLKDNHPKLGLMQRAVSVLFYANGTSKNVSPRACYNKIQD